MKNIFLAKLLVLTICLNSFAHHPLTNKTEVKITDSEHYYEFSGAYDKAKTRNIQQYMNDCITGHNDMSFINTQLDANVTLDSKMTFHIKSYPGLLELKFDKSRNNTNDYIKFKKMCEGIKTIIGKH